MKKNIDNHSTFIGYCFPAMIMTMVCLACSSIFAEKPIKTEKDREKRIRTLINGLGNKNVTINWENESEPYLILPDDFDWKIQEHVSENIEELFQIGKDAFPELIAHMNDTRFCGFRVGAVDSPRKVGQICDCIIEQQIDVFEYDVYAPIVHSWLPHPFYEMIRDKDGRSDAEEWWKSNRHKSLRELQIEAARKAIEILKKSKEDAEDYDSWRNKEIAGLEKLIQELKQSKKPKSADLGFDLHGIHRKEIKRINNENRYYFYNGK
jgi:hypothetical protein